MATRVAPRFLTRLAIKPAMTALPLEEQYKKRDYSKYHYIVIQVKRIEKDQQAEPQGQLTFDKDNVEPSLVQGNTKDICQQISVSAFGGFLVDSGGFGGVLRDHCVVAVEKHSTNPQIPSHVLEKRALDISGSEGDIHLPSSSSSLLDGHTVVWAEEQIPYTHLYKRGPLPTETGESEFIQKVRKTLDLRDPGFAHQWHLVNTANRGFDLNVTGVWEQGITGSNVTVAFIDDGIDHENPDLKDNFSLEGSWDYNEHKQLPTPKLWDDTHGTRCAGEVAAVKNGVCGVGIAYTAKAAGLRVLSGALTNEDEARAVTFACNTTQIYSCSWGPRDDGRTMENPPEIVAKAFDDGIKSCRGGLGAIYVFAAGNGGNSEDNCNADGYTNSIFTITVAAMDNLHNHPNYSERCSAIMISMFSNHGAGMEGIYTTDWTDGCTSKHGGTSAAAPLASGIYALVLSRRPDLNWRDVQRLSVESAIQVNPIDPDWVVNGAGRPYSHKYGYGTFDTYALLERTKTFKNVGPQAKISLKSSPNLDLAIPGQSTDGVTTSLIVSKESLKDLKRLEHVEVTVRIKHPKRGELGLNLISPSGFVSKVMEPRRWDDSPDFNDWTMMSVAHWDENPLGEWKLVVIDATGPDNIGLLNYWTLTLWGEKIVPASTPKATPDVTTVKPSPDSISNSTGSPIDQSSHLNASYGSSTETSALFLFMIFAMLIGGIAYLIYTRGGARLLTNRRRKVILEKEIDQEDLKLQDFDEANFDALAYTDNPSDLEDPIEVRESQVLFQRPTNDSS